MCLSLIWAFSVIVIFCGSHTVYAFSYPSVASLSRDFLKIEISVFVLLLFSITSSFYCVSVANAPNVLQPYWLIVLPLDVPALTASLLL